MKKLTLLFSLFAILPLLAFADISHYNGSTVDVSKITGNWNSFTWNWAGSSTQTNQVTFKNGTAYVPLDDYVVYFRLARQSDTGQVNYLNATNLSKSASNVNFRVEYTNVPPNGGYLAEFYVSEGDSTFRTIGQGKVQVYNSIYGDDDSTYPFPVSTNIYSYPLAGDVGGTMGATVVNKIHGYTMSNTVPAADDVWIFDGTNWVASASSGIYTNLGTALATHEALSGHDAHGGVVLLSETGSLGVAYAATAGNADTATAISEACSNALMATAGSLIFNATTNSMWASNNVSSISNLLASTGGTNRWNNTLTNITVYEDTTNWIATTNGWIYLGIRTNYAESSSGDVYLTGTNNFAGPSNSFAGTIYAPTGNFSVIIGTQNFGVAYAANAGTATVATVADHLQSDASVSWVNGESGYFLFRTFMPAGEGNRDLIYTGTNIYVVQESGGMQWLWNDTGLTLYAGNFIGDLTGNADTATSATSANGLASSVSNALMATAGGLTFGNATNATTLNSQAAAYYLNTVNHTNSSYDPYKISFGASVDVSLANGAIQYYAPTSTTAIYLPASATNLEHYLSITVEPGANSFSFGTNNLYYSTNDTIGVGSGDIRIRTSGPTVLEFIKPFNSAYWRVFSL